MAENCLDEVFTYECGSAQTAAELYLDSDRDSKGMVVRVFVLDRNPPAFILDSDLDVRELSRPPEVKK